MPITIDGDVIPPSDHDNTNHSVNYVAEDDISDLLKLEIVEDGTIEIEGDDSSTIIVDEEVPIYPLLYVEFDSIADDNQHATLDVQYTTNTFLSPQGSIQESFRIKLTNSSNDKVIVDYKIVKMT